MRAEDVPEGPLLVDTDAFSFMLTKRGPYADFASLVAGRLLALSFATVGELRAGAIKRGWGPQRLGPLEQRISAAVVLRSTDEVIDRYGALHARFAGRLQRGGTNDMWTVACALAQPVPPPIVTNNLSDFQTMAGEFPLILIHPDL
jgi:predicted nucleic acid-binding protein